MNPRYQRAMECCARIETEGILGKKLRPAQQKAIRAILYQIYHDKRKYIVLTAPTGAGKSIIAAAVAKICNEVDSWNVNLTTSNRVLQMQYGDELKVDRNFKVIMGNQNYRCSFFPAEEQNTGNKIPGVWSTCGNSPCQKHWEKGVDAFSDDIEGAFERTDKQIKTLHEDQDWDVLRNISTTHEAIEGDLERTKSKIENGAEGEDAEFMTLGDMKQYCKNMGGCSFYYARIAAEQAPIAIRSIQHMAFYIMFGVREGLFPILQARDLHIHDECHHIDRVFRDLFSSEFTQPGYIETTQDALDGTSVDDITYDFEAFKKQEGQWTQGEIQNLNEKIASDLGKIIEATVLKHENILREEGDKIETATDFIRAATENRIVIALDELSKPSKKVLKWFKNISHANYDGRMSARAKVNNQRYDKRYASAVMKSKDGLIFKTFPISLNGMLERYFGNEHTVFMSATPQLPRIFERLFGIVGSVGYVEVDSDFPPERSPIFWDPVDRITTERAKELGAPFVGGLPFKSEKDRERAVAEGNKVLCLKLSEKIEEITESFLGVPGIIPCPSYSLVLGLREYLEENRRFIWATDGDDNKIKIEQFRKRASEGEPVILVSAGIAEGHSFDNGLSRFQIIPKMPLPVQSAEIMEINNRWPQYYGAQTAITLQQMVGRSMRHRGDYCVTVVLDEKFSALKTPSTQKLYSKHFMKCVRWDKDWRNFVFPCD